MKTWGENLYIQTNNGSYEVKDFRKVQEKIQKFSIRKLSVGVGSVAIAALIFGSFLTSPAVAADEVGKTGQAHYTYVEEQELTEQEKELIKHELPSDLQSGENYYLIYRNRFIAAAF